MWFQRPYITVPAILIVLFLIWLFQGPIYRAIGYTPFGTTTTTVTTAVPVQSSSSGVTLDSLHSDVATINDKLDGLPTEVKQATKTAIGEARKEQQTLTNACHIIWRGIAKGHNDAERLTLIESAKTTNAVVFPKCRDEVWTPDGYWNDLGPVGMAYASAPVTEQIVTYRRGPIRSRTMIRKD